MQAFQFNIWNIYAIADWDDKVTSKPDLAMSRIKSFNTSIFIQMIENRSYKCVQYFIQCTCFCYVNETRMWTMKIKNNLIKISKKYLRKILDIFEKISKILWKISDIFGNIYEIFFKNYLRFFGKIYQFLFENILDI